MSEEMSADSFEAKLAKASELLELLNDENISLEESVKVLKEGKKLLNEASEILQNARLIIKEAGDE